MYTAVMRHRTVDGKTTEYFGKKYEALHAVGWSAVVFHASDNASCDIVWFVVPTNLACTVTEWRNALDAKLRNAGLALASFSIEPHGDAVDGVVNDICVCAHISLCSGCGKDHPLYNTTVSARFGSDN